MDHFSQLIAFIWVIEAGNFSAAARAHDLDPSTISKLIAALEARLQVRLFVRGSHKLKLTPEGATYEESARAVIEAMRQAESVAEELPGKVEGVLRIHTMTTFAKHQIIPHLLEFLNLYPNLTVDFRLGAQYVDMFDQGIDVAIHSGALRSSSRVARLIGYSRWIFCASPQYLEQFGRPVKPHDLLRHRCFNFSFPTAWNSWKFKIGDEHISVPVACKAAFTQGDLLRDIALAGGGIVRLANFHIAGDLKSGALMPLLEEYETGEQEPLYFIYPDRKFLSPRIKAFQHFIEKHFQS